MNASKHYRIKKGLTQKQLSALSGINIATLNALEHPNPKTMRTVGYSTYIKLSDALEIPIDELLRDDLPDIRPMRPSNSECPNNCLTIYRRRHHLTLREMASLLDISYETLRLVCRAPEVPGKYIERLAALSGISFNEFFQCYGRG